MSNLEINWWAKMRGDGTDPNDPSVCYGKTIATVELANDVLIFQFDDGAKLAISDDGQQCCEHRYLSADGDSFDYYVGATLLGLDLKKGPDAASGDDDDVDHGCHEIAFLDVLTSKGAFTLSAHNKHNGYYGGFDIRAEVTLP